MYLRRFCIPASELLLDPLIPLSNHLRPVYQNNIFNNTVMEDRLHAKLHAKTINQVHS